MGAALKVSTARSGGRAVVLTAVGELDLSTVGRFEAALREAIADSGPARAELDLGGVQYLDSAAINVLFELADRISVIRVNPLLLRGLSISGLDQIVEVRSVAPD